MGELLRFEELNYAKGIDPKKDHWNKDKFVLLNNKKWDKKSYIKAYMNLLTNQINKEVK